MKNKLAFIFLLLLLSGVVFLSLNLSSTPKMPGQKTAINVTTTEAEKRLLPILVHLMRPGDGESDLSLFVIKELAREFRGLFVLKNINVDKEPEASSFYQINNIPTVILLTPNKRIFFRHEGYVEKQLLLKKIRLAAEQT
jgi:thioredoxin 1